MTKKASKLIVDESRVRSARIIATGEAIKARDAVKKAMDRVQGLFKLPATFGNPDETRLALDSALSGTVGFDSICGTLGGHAADMGQFPTTSFVGYGALQQIAQNGMIRNCIKTVADDVTREWITIKGGEDVDPEKIEELTTAVNEYRLQELFNRAVAKVGFMGGAFIYIRTEASPETGGDIDKTKPLVLNRLSAEIGEGSALSFILVDPICVSPGAYNAYDPLRSDYMKPTKWLVQGVEVHASRLLAMYANEPPTLLKPAYNFLGIPQAQILWDYVLHWNECRIAAQDLIKKLALLIYYTNLQDRMASQNGLEELDAVMGVLQHYRSNDSVFVANADTDRVENVQTSVGGVQDIVRQAQEMIAAVNRTPAVKLFGISPSGFNATGESDIRNYYDHIRSQQELYRPVLEKCIKAIQLRLWGNVEPTITFEWNELDMDNESAQAMNFASRANALAALKDRDVISAEEMRQAVRLDKSSHLAFLSEEVPPPEEGELQTDDPLADLMSAFGRGQENANGETNENGSNDGA